MCYVYHVLRNVKLCQFFVATSLRYPALPGRSFFAITKGSFFLKNETFILNFLISAIFFCKNREFEFQHFSHKVNCVVNSNSLALQKI